MYVWWRPLLFCMCPTERCCLILQRKMPTTTPSLRSAQGGLPGERDSASEVKYDLRSSHIRGHFPNKDKGNYHGLCFWHVCLVLDETEPNNQNWFGENDLLSLYMGLHHPQKLFLMPDRCSETIWENTSFGWNFGSLAFGLRWCLSSSQKKKKYNCHVKEEENDSILSKWIY